MCSRKTADPPPAVRAGPTAGARDETVRPVIYAADVLLLAFDTATPATTAAVHDGRRVLAETVTVDARRHGELLMPSIISVLGQAGAARHDVTAVVVGTGPGPYTGLRVGLVTARVLGAALGVPAYGVCTLDAIARAAVTAAAGREFLVATDARRKEVYWARYSAAGRRILGPEVGRPAGLDPAAPAAGEGPRLYPESFGDPIGPRYPAASMLADLAAERLAAGAVLPPAEPLYLRRPDARVPGPPKRVSPA
jgi:tRNA threonylcarbamoyl adenosine modification protein YeaZ